MNYTDILSRAWKITWRHKILWIFGILSGCGQGGGGNNGTRFNASGGPGNFPGGEAFQRFTERPEFLYIVGSLVVLALIVGLAVFVLSIIGRGGLIGGAGLAAENGAVTFGEAWGVGVRSFWRLLGIGLLVALPFIVLLALGVAGTVLTAGLGLACLLPLLCVLVLALIPVSIVAHFAQFAVVLDDERAIDALRKGWNVLKSNLGPILILGIILIVIGFIAGLILALPLIALVVPVAGAFILGQGEDPSMPLLIAAGLGFLCYLPFLIVLSGILQTWTMSAWTLAYRQFTGGQVAPVETPSAPVPAV